MSNTEEGRDGQITPGNDSHNTTAPAAHVNAFYPPLQLARAYVPVQRYGKTLTPAEALGKGTLFPELYSPYPY
ncbi:spore coat associated protein CotJA [Desulfotomaculum copahuensis]|uniref:Spore coat associated protein CotJA n=1 Tax=Desulfotomaculum copahuensis TaxID=1838280 RepID=A0A1B7LIS6_9FIRM|nr:spore coat associated protein CotJA [Desulfotomaculum copahuensis]OAT86464.1 hypothetical protein A6M21_03325 [Desulfotomaculum copahuensis]